MHILALIILISFFIFSEDGSTKNQILFFFLRLVIYFILIFKADEWYKMFTGEDYYGAYIGLALIFLCPIFEIVWQFLRVKKEFDKPL